MIIDFFNFFSRRKKPRQDCGLCAGPLFHKGKLIEGNGELRYVVEDPATLELETVKLAICRVCADQLDADAEATEKKRVFPPDEPV